MAVLEIDEKEEFIRGLTSTYHCLTFLNAGQNIVIAKEGSENVHVIAGSTECLAGLVGEGLLSAAIWGDVSGSSVVSCFNNVLELSEECKDYLVIVDNNSSVGSYNAASGSAEYKVKTVTVGCQEEITALTKNLLVFKVAGAAAALGLSLDLVAAEAQHASDMVQNSFSSLSTDDDALTDLFNRFVEADTSVPLNSEGSSIILLINGSSDTSFEKMMTITERVVKKMSKFGIQAERVYSGMFFPFRDIEEVLMIRIDKKVLGYMKAPTIAPLWPAELVASFQKSPEKDSRLSSDFEVERFLGQGGFGNVTLCEHKLDRQQYAVKRVPSETDRLIPVEVAALSRLNHKNVVRYHQAWIGGISCTGLTPTPSIGSLSDVSPPMESDKLDESGKKYLFMQMEYCPSNLFDVIEEFTFEKNWAWKALHELVSGLVCIHGAGFTHGDLVPQNIFLDSENNIKIGDFGLALGNGDGFDGVYVSPIDRRDLEHRVYRAPEIAQGGLLSEKVDIYSLGIIACQLLNDSGIFQNLELARQDMTIGLLPACLDWVAEKHPNLHQILSRLTSFDPDDRPTAVEILTCLNDAGLHGE